MVLHLLGPGNVQYSSSDFQILSGCPIRLLSRMPGGTLVQRLCPAARTSWEGTWLPWAWAVGLPQGNTGSPFCQTVLRTPESPEARVKDLLCSSEKPGTGTFTYPICKRRAGEQTSLPGAEEWVTQSWACSSSTDALPPPWTCLWPHSCMHTCTHIHPPTPRCWGQPKEHC